MCLILQETKVKVQVLEPCKYIQESSKEVLYFKAWQIYLSRFKIWSSTDKLNSCIKNYENQIFRFDFTHIHVYVFRLSFLTTLNIYKDYFKGCQRSCKLVKLDAKVFCKHIVTRDICPSSSFSWRSCCVYTPKGFVTKEFRDLHHVNELKNFAANIFPKLVC